MAARKKSRNRGNPENPNTVLVVFMVFFILLSIGLGVGTYYGYAGQKKSDDEAINARKEAKAARDRSEYYKFQSLVTRAAEDPKYLFKDDKTDEANDLGVLMDEFETQNKFDKEASRPTIVELVAKLKKELDWNAGEKRFKTTWSKKFETEENDLKKVKKDFELEKDARKKKEDELNFLQTKYNKHWSELKKEFVEYNDVLLKKAKDRTQEMEKKFDVNKELQTKLETAQTELDNVKRKMTKTINTKDTKITELEDKVATLTRQLEKQKAELALANATLMVGDFAGKWTGTLMRGGAVELDIKADGTVIWSVPDFAREQVSGVNKMEKAGENYVVNIQNQPVRLFLAGDRRGLRMTGGGMDAALSRK